MNDKASITYDNVNISTSSFPLYANISNSAATKSFLGNEEYVTLESLLDRSKERSKTFKNYYLKEIPFRLNSDPSHAIISKYMPSDLAVEYISEICVFLIETTDLESDTIDCKVVTMIPDEKYCSTYGVDDMSFINKGIFSGIVLFSGLDGSFRDIYMYEGNFSPIINAEVVDGIKEESGQEYIYLSVLNEIQTRSSSEDDDGSGILLEASFCIAYTTNVEFVKPNPIDFPTAIDRPEFGGSGGGNGGVNDDVSEDVQKYYVSLHASEGGYVCGSGYYPEGVGVICTAQPYNGHRFDRWVGDLKGQRFSRAFVKVDRDIEATAYFYADSLSGKRRPCYDSLKNVMNPLIDMYVAASSTWNPQGGTYGMTRFDKDGNKKFHSGLDLYAEPGTPIFAMYDGVVSDYNYCVEQVNRISKKEYPIGYRGDIDGAGNRVHIKCIVNNREVLIGYWHLLEGTPVAINPRTHKPYAPGDKVYQGETIGYTGRTGNCYDIPNYHLHLVVVDYEKRNAGNVKYLNPEDYINGNVDWTDDNKRTLESLNIINIDCHDENENAKYF